MVAVLVCIPTNSVGVKDQLEVPEVRSDLPRDASAEMGLISPAGVKKAERRRTDALNCGVGENS